jgi:putative addiction module component (TIGR02574 family)
MADPARLLEEALSLDPEQRARIARRLIGSLEEPDADAEALWRQEIRRRIDAIEAGTAELEDWETVRGRVRAAIES